MVPFIIYQTEKYLAGRLSSDTHKEHYILRRTEVSYAIIIES
jgi:hypothetical protein